MKIDSLRPRRWQAGFSLIELLIVIAIILVVSAMAMPSIMVSINQIQLRSSMRDVIGLMQQARQSAVKNNAFYRLGVSGNTVYIDFNNDGIFQSGGANCPGANCTPPEFAVQLPNNVTLQPNGAPAFPNALAGANFNPQPVNVPPAFNARGLPCVIVAGACNSRSGAAVPGASGANVAFLYFYTQQRTFGPQGWAAITVTPAGRMKSWMYEPRTATWSD